MSESDLEDIAEILARKPTPSTKSMHIVDRCNGVHQMLMDLQELAKRDGCIAAAWALEFAVMIAEQERQGTQRCRGNGEQC